MKPTICLDTYWRFATERQRIYHHRLRQPEGPWTEDPVLSAYRFTNAYRASDRVSQYLIREVQYGHGSRFERGQGPVDVFFRTMLFKLFNSVATWEVLELCLGQIEYQTFDWGAAETALDGIMNDKRPVYSAAYIMPDVPQFGGGKKHRNHLRLLYKMIQDGLPHRLQDARTLKAVYELMLAQPGFGPFLAFQYTIDLNYSTLLDHDEASFVVAGPGALDGLSKCFSNVGGRKPEHMIQLITDFQEYEFQRLGLDFQDLFGRRLQPIDCQNLFCEISKYSRVAHPELVGKAGRTKIKQGYAHVGRPPMPVPFFPPKWGINSNIKIGVDTP
jgi:5-hmdU DNA kinase-like protein